MWYTFGVCLGSLWDCVDWCLYYCTLHSASLAVVCLFSLLSNIPGTEYTMIYFFTPFDGYLGCLQFRARILFLWILGPMVLVLCVLFSIRNTMSIGKHSTGRQCQRIFKKYILPLAGNGSSGCSVSLPTFGIATFFYFNHADKCVVVFHYNLFDLSIFSFNFIGIYFTYKITYFKSSMSFDEYTYTSVITTISR